MTQGEEFQWWIGFYHGALCMGEFLAAIFLCIETIGRVKKWWRPA